MLPLLYACPVCAREESPTRALFVLGMLLVPLCLFGVLAFVAARSSR